MKLSILLCDRRGPLQSLGVALMLAGIIYFVAPSPILAEPPASAQDDDPELMFEELVLTQGVDVDDARQQVASKYGQAVATEIAVYWCSPDPLDGCEGSNVLAAWLEFEHLIIDEDYSADEARVTLSDEYDESLVAALAVYWCSPEPLEGCSGSEVEMAWGEFDDLLEAGRTMNDILAQLSPQHGRTLIEGLAAYACGDLECAEVEPEGPEPDQPAPQATRRSTKKNKYGTKGKSPRRK